MIGLEKRKCRYNSSDDVDMLRKLKSLQILLVNCTKSGFKSKFRALWDFYCSCSLLILSMFC